MTLAVGTRLGPYQIVGQIGAGGMGEVYRGRDPRLGRDVAIKVLPAGVTQDAERRNRFEQEARAASALNHPNIVSIFDIGSQDGVLYVVQELLEGETLRERLKNGPISARKAADYAVQVARGLAAAHEKGIIHRDLKPENLFLIRDGRVKILDFGLAKLVQVKASAQEATSAPTEALGTEPGVVMGTVGYMSPEQVRGQIVDHRSDIFSFGAILYEALTGKRAFQAGSAVETMSAILTGEPPELSRANPNLPPAMERILRHCLEKNPEERFYSARDLAFDLESPGSLSTTAPAAARARRRGIPAVGLAVAALLAGVSVSRVAFPSRGIELSAYRFAAFATEQGYKSSPAWSPDGKAIAYSQTVNGNAQIFTRSLGQPTPVQLTRLEGDGANPFWSPDGARIYYSAPSDGTPSLWTISAAGGQPNLVATGIAAATIAPDGKTLAFLRRDDQSLWIASPPAGKAHKLSQGLPNFLANAVYLRFSPDGTRVGASLAVGEKRCEFWTVSALTGESKFVFRMTSHFAGPIASAFSWFPDSRYVVLSGTQALEMGDHLLAGDTHTGEIRSVTANFRGEGFPAVSRDGTAIAFSSDEEDTDLVEIPLDGSAMRSLLTTSGQEHCADWSPVGRQFAYSKSRGGGDEVWLRNPQEGWERPLITRDRFTEGDTDRVTELRFSPDGQRVAFVRVASGRYKTWIASVAGGPPVPLTQEAEGNELVPAWSPDGNWVAFFSLTLGGRPTLAKANAGGGGRPIPLKTPNQSDLTRTHWSPRGDWLLWLGSDGLYLVAADGTKFERVSAQRDWQSYGFSKDGGAVLGVRLGSGHHWLVCSVDIASKKERVISDLGLLGDIGFFHAFSLAPDGKSFITSVTHRTGDIWILEGFPPPARLFGRWWR